MRNARFSEFETPEALAAALAELVAERLRAAIAARGRATLAVSGGTTPGAFFDALSNIALDWEFVTVILVDERLVPPSSERSNERLVRERLLKGEAGKARFIGLWSEAASPEVAARRAADRLAALSMPLDVVVLGMGADGHTASFFSDAPNFARLTDPAQPSTVLAVHTKAGGEPRLTLTLPVLAQARLTVLHIEGAEKRAVVERALAGAPLGELPVGAILDHAAHPVEIVWAPKQEQQP
jgi:6-phosphogluconolactonase